MFFELVKGESVILIHGPYVYIFWCVNKSCKYELLQLLPHLDCCNQLNIQI